MKCGVVVFPGSNCDDDLFYVLSQTMRLPTVKLWHKDTDLQGCDMVFLPGGFSYGDYLRSGAIARFSPIMREVVAFAHRGGWVMGICNGFQILTEADLLPGTLLRNLNQRFVCRNILIIPNAEHPAAAGLSAAPLNIPIAHAEGRYYAPKEMLEELEANQQVIFRYCNQAGEPEEAANPNGSLHHIAGISNRQGNVIGMMPHPERAASTVLGNTDGLSILESLLALVA